MVEIKRGQVWVADLRPGSPRLAGKHRPVIIAQADWLLKSKLKTVTVIPLTASKHAAENPLRPLVKKQDRLMSPSHAMVDQLQSIEINKLGEGPLAHVDAMTMQKIDRSLMMVLGLVRF